MKVLKKVEGVKDAAPEKRKTEKANNNKKVFKLLRSYKARVGPITNDEME